MNRASLLLGSVLLVALGLTARGVGAEEPPAPKPPAPPAPSTSPESGDKPADAPKEPATPEAPPADRPEPARPSVAWREIQKEMSDPAKRKPGLVESRSREYIAQWEAAKQEPQAEDLLALGQLYAAAQMPAKATEVYRKGANTENLTAGQRVQHATSFANLTLSSFSQGTLKGEAFSAAVREVEAWVPLAEGTPLAGLLGGLGYLHKAEGKTDQAVKDWVGAAAAANDRAYQMADRIVDAVVEDLHTLESIAPARAKLAPILAQLSAHQAAALAAARKLRDEEQDGSMKSRRDQAFRAAENAAERMKDVDKPLRMLGEQAPEWKLEKAYGKGKSIVDYRGKVVLLDFWATWCPWCIKSFPALRDLVRDYGEKGLEVVGVTTSASSVWDQRYNLDDDLKDKAVGASTQPVAKRPTAPPAASGDGSQEAGADATAEYEAALKEYKAKEQDAITSFIANHAMTWDVIQIDEKEPGPKYAVSGWPHAVLVDRHGRVRHLHSGALLKDKAEALAAFRKILEGLLAEPAPKK